MKSWLIIELCVTKSANLLAAFGPTIEPWMWGIVSAVFLSGVVIAQAYTYFTSEEEDSPWLKSYVGFLVSLFRGFVSYDRLRETIIQIILSLVEGVCDVVILHFRLIMVRSFFSPLGV